MRQIRKDYTKEYLDAFIIKCAHLGKDAEDVMTKSSGFMDNMGSVGRRIGAYAKAFPSTLMGSRIQPAEELRDLYTRAGMHKDHLGVAVADKHALMQKYPELKNVWSELDSMDAQAAMLRKQEPMYNNLRTEMDALEALKARRRETHRFYTGAQNNPSLGNPQSHWDTMQQLDLRGQTHTDNISRLRAELRKIIEPGLQGDAAAKQQLLSKIDTPQGLSQHINEITGVYNIKAKDLMDVLKRRSTGMDKVLGKERRRTAQALTGTGLAGVLATLGLSRTGN